MFLSALIIWMSGYIGGIIGSYLAYPNSELPRFPDKRWALALCWPYVVVRLILMRRAGYFD